MDAPATIIKLYEDGTITICPLNRRKGAFSELEKAARREKLCELGKKEKNFVLSSREKRIIKCSAIRMWHTKKNSLKWFTLTFSKTVSQVDANKCLSKFVENLKLNYHAQSYIIVKENHVSGNPHFHCIIDIPFVNFARLNNAWCNACRGFMPYSRNALTSGYTKIISNIQGVANYVAKYISKAGGESKTRIYFISNNILPQPKTLTYNEYIYFTTSFESKTIVTDNFTIVFLKKFAYLPEMFNLPERVKKEKKHQKIPDYINANLDF